MIQVWLSIWGLVLVLLLYSKRRAVPSALRFYRMVFKIPGPWSILFTGVQYAAFKETDFLDFIMEQLRRHRVLKFWLFGTPHVFVKEPEDLEAILGNTRNMNKGEIYRVLEPWLGNGILLSTGLKWRKMKKILTQAYHVRGEKDHTLGLNKHAKRIVTELTNTKSQAVDIKNILEIYMLDVVQDVIFGMSEFRKKEGQEYLKALKRPLTMECTHQQHAGYDRNGVLNVVVQRVLNIVMHFDCIFRLTPTGIKFKKDIGIINDFADKIIGEHLKERECNNYDSDRPKGVLDELIEYHKAEPGMFTRQDIIREVNNITFGAFDTTTTTSTFVLYLIGVYQNVQEKLFKEVSEILGDSERDVTLKDVGEMKYLEMVIKESMRVYPSVSVVSRQITNDVVLDEGTLIPVGAHVMIVIYSVHRNPKYFPDPDKFDPERFTEDEVAKRPRYSYIPFSGGPRKCIGQEFGMLEMKILISSIVQRFHIVSLAKREDLKLKPGMMLATETPILIRFDLRKPCDMEKV